MILTQGRVVVYHQDIPRYSTKPPYHPPVAYPECPIVPVLDASNRVYHAMREALHLYGLDAAHWGEASWNPLGELVQPGDTVLLKPNMIAHAHRYNDDWDYVITHGSVLRAMVDYVYIALQGQGTIIIADAPQPDSHMDRIKQRLGIEALQDLFWRQKRFDLVFLDLRDEFWIEKDGIYTDRVSLRGDPHGNVRVNLGQDSSFAEVDALHRRYYGAFYDIDATNDHHSGGLHEYMISRTALEADVFISLPKMKTHKKVGVTLNLKGLVGINGDKNWLPHYAIGAPGDNGDQFPHQTMSHRLENTLVIKAKHLLLKQNPLLKLAARKLKRVGYALLGDTEEVVRSGNWHGNDTCWRMTLDLNRILLYANPNGTFRSTPKRYLSVVDGIVGMEGNGPVAGTPKSSGFLVVGCNPLATDLVCTTLMGFDYRKLPMLCRAFDPHRYPLAAFTPQEIAVLSNHPAYAGPFSALTPEPSQRFAPHFGWAGKMEL
jgi:uncharacterized protein (DUF362 family)